MVTKWWMWTSPEVELQNKWKLSSRPHLSFLACTFLLPSPSCLEKSPSTELTLSGWAIALIEWMIGLIHCKIQGTYPVTQLSFTWCQEWNVEGISEISEGFLGRKDFFQVLFCSLCIPGLGQEWLREQSVEPDYWPSCVILCHLPQLWNGANHPICLLELFCGSNELIHLWTAI